MEGGVGGGRGGRGGGGGGRGRFPADEWPAPGGWPDRGGRPGGLPGRHRLRVRIALHTSEDGGARAPQRRGPPAGGSGAREALVGAALTGAGPVPAAGGCPASAGPVARMVAGGEARMRGAQTAGAGPGSVRCRTGAGLMFGSRCPYGPEMVPCPLHSAVQVSRWMATIWKFWMVA